jgi:hypothetical protein
LQTLQDLGFIYRIDEPFLITATAAAPEHPAADALRLATSAPTFPGARVATPDR